MYTQDNSSRHLNCCFSFWWEKMLKNMRFSETSPQPLDWGVLKIVLFIFIECRVCYAKLKFSFWKPFFIPPLLSQSFQISCYWWFHERTNILICLSCEYKNISSKLQPWLYLVNAFHDIKCLHCWKVFINLRLFSCQKYQRFSDNSKCVLCSC